MIHDTPADTVRSLIHQGRPEIAVRVAYQRGLIVDADFDAAYQTGIDVLLVAGLGRPLSPMEQAAIDAVDTDPDHELRAALAEVRRLRDGIGVAVRLLDQGHPSTASMILRSLLGPVDLTDDDGPEAA